MQEMQNRMSVLEIITFLCEFYHNVEDVDKALRLIGLSSQYIIDNEEDLIRAYKTRQKVATKLLSRIEEESKKRHINLKRYCKIRKPMNLIFAVVTSIIFAILFIIDYYVNN